MRHVLKIVVTMLVMLMFAGPAYAESALTPDEGGSYGAAPTPIPVVVEPPKPTGPPAPLFGADIQTTDHCFVKYPQEKDPCGLKACLLTLERESRDVVQELFGQCMAEQPVPIAAAVSVGK